jgi:hypothetical protein
VRCSGCAAGSGRHGEGAIERLADRVPHGRCVRRGAAEAPLQLAPPLPVLLRLRLLLLLVMVLAAVVLQRQLLSQQRPVLGLLGCTAARCCRQAGPRLQAVSCARLAQLVDDPVYNMPQ